VQYMFAILLCAGKKLQGHACCWNGCSKLDCHQFGAVLQP